MTSEEKKIKRYVTQIERHLRLPLETRARINSDIGTEIHLRMEEGKTASQVMEEMGSPKEVAERFNQEFPESNVRKNPVRFLFLIIAFIILVTECSTLYQYFQFLANANSAISVIGGADGPSSTFIAAKLSPLGYWISSAGLALGCIAAYFLISYGRTASAGKYWKCILLSGLGLILNLLPLFQNTGMLQWSVPLGTFGIVIAPGFLLCVVTLILSIRRYQHARRLLDSQL